MRSDGPPMAPDSRTAMFEDFDLDEVFAKATPHAENQNSQNFVVEFGPDHARIAFDLGSAAMKSLLESERDVKNYPIRWMYAIAPDPDTSCPAHPLTTLQEIYGIRAPRERPWSLLETIMNSLRD